MARLLFVFVLGVTACSSPSAELPGSYVGDLSSNNSASRMQNRRPDGNGGFVADVTHYSAGTSTSNARVVIRAAGEDHGNPTFTADLNGLCELRFQLLDGGQLTSNLETSSCGCMLDGERVDGHTSVVGSYRDGRLSLDVSVGLQGTGAYAGGCAHTFAGTKQPLTS